MQTKSKDVLQLNVKDAFPEFYNVVENIQIVANKLNKIIKPIQCLSKAFFNYVPKDIEKENVKSISMNEDHSVFITYTDDSMELVDNPLNIEDLKILL